MKIQKYISILALISAFVFTACSDDDELGKNNKDKTKPTVSAQIVNVLTDVRADVSFTVSDNAEFVAYALMRGTDNPTPDKQQLIEGVVSGNVTSAVMFADEIPSFVTFNGLSVSSDYELFYAAMTETGLIGDVEKLAITTSSGIRTGTYEFDYIDVYGNPDTFELEFTRLDSERYLWSGFLNTPGPELVGVFDWNTKTLTFDGTEEDGVNIFGMLYYYYDASRTMVLAFFGDGDGYDPIIVQVKEVNGELYLDKTDSGFSWELFLNSSGYPYLGTMDSAADGGTFKYVENARSMSTKMEKGLSEIEKTKDFTTVRLNK